MISKDNYEIWMMDYLDGNLSDANKSLLLQFLEEHPLLKEELNGLEKTFLKPTEDKFELKDSLLKTSVEELRLDYADYIAVKEVEEGLDEEENQWKSSYLKEDKDRSKLFALYAKTVLKADQSIRYHFKGNLKRAVLIPMLNVNAVKRISVAAAIALLLSVGSVPFLRNSTDDIKTIVVNDTPSLITIPKKQQKQKGTTISKPINKVESKVENKKVTNQKASLINKVTEEVKTNNVAKIDKVEPNGIEYLKTEHVNAYEVGLNAMMPIIIANNMAEREEEYLAMQSQVKEESVRLSRSARAIASGVKVINFLSGNETKMNKVLNQDGQMVAYQLESDNISIRQRIKNKPVTN